MVVDKHMEEWLKRMDGYRKHREEGFGEKILYAPSAFPKTCNTHTEEKEESGECCQVKNTQKTYDELSKPTESERLQDELEPISHPAMGPKQDKGQTLEEQKQELEDSMVASRHQEYIRIEMNKIREEWKPWVEKNVTDTHKVIYEAERRVNANKDIK